MTDQKKLAKANDTSRAQSQQDELRTPADLEVVGSRGGGVSATGDGPKKDDSRRKAS